MANPEVAPVGPEVVPSAPEREPEPKYDAVFILPSYPFPQKKVEGLNFEGLGERIAGRPKKFISWGLLFDTRLKDVAAAVLVRSGETKTLVPMSKAIRSWMHDSFANLMEKHLQALLRKSKTEVAIVKESESYDLFTEVEQIPPISKANGFRKVGILTDSAHAKRTKQIIERLQAKGQTFPEYEIREMEQILSDEKYDQFVPKKLKGSMDKFHKSLYWKFWRAREFVARMAPELMSRVSAMTR